ncbi:MULTISPECIES: ABC transporter permease [Donghicola]|jgi:NitT/TauT family transport system permease protein|uniref:ABC transporter permease n=1 Tax=Donghicola sp. TaxID=1929294 RepID=UPI0025F08FDC|nr:MULTISPECIES: ABC transporter permease subunit [Donghicola]MCI5038459.1 ABC transporter permease subunit [Donghicola eburneus]MCT4577623.1 ABC transporter permease subunit [Donghicola sp.]
MGKSGVTAVSLAALLCLWVVAAWATADPMVLPYPGEVLSVIVDHAQSGKLWTHMGATLQRVLMAFALAMIGGGALGVVLGQSDRLNLWLDPWVTVLLNVPALVIIVLCYLWIGLNEVAAIFAVALNKFAMVTVTIREGVRALDRGVTEMAQVYRMPLGARLRHVVWPQLGPFVAASTRNGLAVIWKIVLVVEFLGRSNGVGFQIHLYFQLFDTASVLAYALSFTALMLAIEYLIVQRWERASSAWRRA